MRGHTEVERTDDGRYIVVRGRRWRASDPDLDEDVRSRLQGHLGRARSAIGRADTAERKVPWRTRVQLAKEGLGERGTPWWELTSERRAARAADALRRLDAACPESETRE